ncbi:MAG: NADH-quinone oxidoreductase subunit A [Parachlamydiaceae bacterium]
MEWAAVYIYFGVCLAASLAVLLASGLTRSEPGNPVKFLPYESGIQTETHLFQKRFPLHHYLVALIFLVFDVEVIFLFPWAVVAKSLGAFAFYEMFFFLLLLLAGFGYAWKKGGLTWD